MINADKAREIANRSKHQLDYSEAKIKLESIMYTIKDAANAGAFALRDPFKGLSPGVLHLVCKELRMAGYTIEFNVGDDGPGRPGHDEIRWD